MFKKVQILHFNPGDLIRLAFPPIAVAACGYQGPPCEEVTVADLAAETASGTPVFTWTGGDVDDLFVLDAWTVHCEPEDRPCLSSPITYGETPSAASTDDMDGVHILDPVELVSGDNYTVGINLYCKGGDDIQLTTGFAAP